MCSDCITSYTLEGVEASQASVVTELASWGTAIIKISLQTWAKRQGRIISIITYRARGTLTEPSTTGQTFIRTLWTDYSRRWRLEVTVTADTGMSGCQGSECYRSVAASAIGCGSCAGVACRVTGLAYRGKGFIKISNSRAEAFLARWVKNPQSSHQASCTAIRIYACIAWIVTIYT